MSTVVQSSGQIATESTRAYCTAFDPSLKRRGKSMRNVSIVICVLAVIPTIIFCFIVEEVNECMCSVSMDTKNMPPSSTTVFSSLFTIALTLYSIVLGTILDRLSLVSEEHRHLYSRYDTSVRKMLKACFSGVVWGLASVLVGVATIILIFVLATASSGVYKLKHFLHIFTGVFLTPLIMRLLNKDTKSDVYVSKTLEKGMYVANGLAWSYYLNYLQPALIKFSEVVNKPFPSPHENVELSQKKLVLLVPLVINDRINDDLQDLDSKIEKLFDLGNEQDPFHFSVYSLVSNEQQTYYFAIQCAKQPLRCLREIKQFRSERPSLKDEIKLLYKTMSEILKDPLCEDIPATCVLVPMLASNGLENGGLVKRILYSVECSGTEAHTTPEVDILHESCRPFTVPMPMVDERATRAVTSQSETRSSLVRSNDVQRVLEIVDPKGNEENDEKRESARKKHENSKVKLHMTLIFDVNRREVNKVVHKVGNRSCSSSIGKNSQILNISDGSEYSGHVDITDGSEDSCHDDFKESSSDSV